MPALNVTFTDEEMAAIRDAAAKEGTSLKNLAHDAVLADVRQREIDALIARTARISAGLNRWLADK
jgi:hypothetical protein